MWVYYRAIETRFTLHARLDYYSREDMVGIIQRTCGLLEVEINEDGAKEIAGAQENLGSQITLFILNFAQQKLTAVLTADGSQCARTTR